MNIGEYCTVIVLYGMGVMTHCDCSCGDVALFSWDNDIIAHGGLIVCNDSDFITCIA